MRQERVERRLAWPFASDLSYRQRDWLVDWHALLKQRPKAHLSAPTPRLESPSRCRLSVCLSAVPLSVPLTHRHCCCTRLETQHTTTLPTRRPRHIRRLSVPLFHSSRLRTEREPTRARTSSQRLRRQPPPLALGRPRTAPLLLGRCACIASPSSDHPLSNHTHSHRPWRKCHSTMARRRWPPRTSLHTPSQAFCLATEDIGREEQVAYHGNRRRRILHTFTSRMA